MRTSILLLFLLLAACSASPSVDPSAIQTQAAQTVIAGFATPVPPVLDCDPNPFLTAAQSSMDKFQDISKRAGSTSRISLSPVIGEMQEVRREYRALVAPECAVLFQQLILEAMGAEIDGYLSFMAQDSDSTVQSKFSVAAVLWEKAVVERQEVNYRMGTPRPPTAIPPPTIDAAPYVKEVRSVIAQYEASVVTLKQIEDEYDADHALGKDEAWRDRVAVLAEQFKSGASRLRALPVPTQFLDAHRELLSLADNLRGVGQKLDTFLALDNAAYLYEAGKDSEYSNARLPLSLEKIDALE